MASLVGVMAATSTWQVVLSNGKQYTVTVESSGVPAADKLRAESRALGLWDREVGFSPGVTVQESRPA